MIDFYGVPTWALNRIKAGDDWQLADGTVIPHERLTTPADPIRSYAYCSDTMPNDELVPMLKDVDLLYHEATYADSESTLANKYGHSTAKQAATIAKAAGARRLLLGHFSSRYDDENILLAEAKRIFPETTLAYEGLRITP